MNGKSVMGFLATTEDEGKELGAWRPFLTNIYKLLLKIRQFEKYFVLPVNIPITISGAALSLFECFPDYPVS